MEIIKPDIAIDFMGMRKKTGILSGIACAASLMVLAIFGLNQGIDFKGGSAVIVTFKEGAAERDKLETAMHDLVLKETGDTATQVSVQDFDIGIGADPNEEAMHRYLVYTEVTSLLNDAKRGEIATKIKASFGEGTRVDMPAEGADTFYVTFPEDVPVLERSDALRALFGELGFDQTRIISGAEEQLEIERAADLSLVLSEKEANGDDGFDGEVVTREAWEKQKLKKLETKSDRRFKVSVEELKAKVTEMLGQTFGEGFIRVESSTSVSPSVGRDLLNNGLLAVLYAIIGILIYISLRFDFRFAPGAVVALVHDVIITMGIFAIFQVKFSLPIIAALLTIVGYSLNDTIVVLDRVRETFETYRGRDLKDLLNRAINETLSRTTLTSATTLFVVISIVSVGGGLIRDFALALLIGIVIGTYSSIFIASPLVYYMDEYITRRNAKQRVAAK
ncbi:MAG: protein translocase subunit SecF [Myxococcota bacterium]